MEKEKPKEKKIKEKPTNKTSKKTKDLALGKFRRLTSTDQNSL